MTELLDMRVAEMKKDHFWGWNMDHWGIDPMYFVYVERLKSAQNHIKTFSVNMQCKIKFFILRVLHKVCQNTSHGTDIVHIRLNSSVRIHHVTSRWNCRRIKFIENSLFGMVIRLINFEWNRILWLQLDR